MREAVQNSLGWPVGIAKPKLELVELAGRIVTDANPVLEESAALVAVTVTSAGDGAAEGAVYIPVVLIVPQAVPLQPAPCKFQVTDVFVVPVTAAFNC